MRGLLKFKRFSSTKCLRDVNKRLAAFVHDKRQLVRAMLALKDRNEFSLKDSIRSCKAIHFWKFKREATGLRQLGINTASCIDERRREIEAESQFYTNLNNVLSVKWSECSASHFEIEEKMNQQTLSQFWAESRINKLQQSMLPSALPSRSKALLGTDTLNAVTSALGFDRTALENLHSEKFLLAKAKPRNNLAIICADILIGLHPRQLVDKMNHQTNNL